MFNHLYCNSVEVQKIIGYSDYDTPILDEVIECKGKLEYEIKTISDKNGNQVVSSGEFRTSEKLSEQDKINVNGIFKDIINITPIDDFSGKTLYYIIYF